MKQIILIGVLMGLLTATIPLQAQVAQRDSDARKGSRLELGRTSPVRKTTTPGLPSQRFSIAPSPTLSGLDRSMTLNKNSAINAHYRSLLMTHSGAKATAHVTAVENAQTVESATRPAIPAQEGKGENKLYNNEKLWVSNAYPNPADDVAEVDYQFTGANEAKLVLLNVLGAPVAEYELERNERKVQIGTRLLDTGYYLYQLSVDGKKVATKRLLVRHQ
ncbi:T9SS type A sorting domain-containing protein [Spirosoma flavum]|uniref:T9SS type A sorting domain-containing protein n=1 Tax=Spirosoma flavum TaxID=2048557 RepID=A0ABW6APX7_9BACT